jgi:hypothetical protein
MQLKKPKFTLSPYVLGACMLLGAVAWVILGIAVYEMASGRGF